MSVFYPKSTKSRYFHRNKPNKFEVAKYIVKKDVSNYLIKAKVEDLVERIFPKVLVIVDDNNESWKSQIENLGAFYCTLQVFKNKNSLHVYRLDGDYPFVPEKSSNCKFLSGLPTLLQVLQPEWFIEQFNKKYLAEIQNSKSFSRRVRNLYLKYFTKSTLLSSAPDPNIIEVGFQGKICRLKVIIETEGVFLRPIGQMSFPVTNEYVLECDSTFRFYLKLT